MSPRSKIQFEQIREESKQRILDAALNLFALQGYASTSVASIAKEANISKGLIYNYYKSKEDIAKACTEHLLNMFMVMMDGMDEAKTAQEKLQALIVGYFKFIDDYGTKMMTLFIRFSLELSKFNFFKEVFDSKMQQYIEFIQPIFKELGYENPKHAAWELGIIMDGIGLHLSTGLDFNYINLAKEIIAKKYNIDLS